MALGKGHAPYQAEVKDGRQETTNQWPSAAGAAKPERAHHSTAIFRWNNQMHQMTTDDMTGAAGGLGADGDSPLAVKLIDSQRLGSMKGDGQLAQLLS